MDQVIVKAPLSKSVSHRRLIGAALARGESRLSGVLESRDIEQTRSVLEDTGARFERIAPGEWRVLGMGGGPRGGDAVPVSCYVHESGTTCRLLTAVLASGLGQFRVHGAPRMHSRPIGELTAALEKLGVAVRFENEAGYPPFILKTRGLEGGSLEIGLGESSQYLSGLLLAAPQAKSPVTIEICGSHVVSWPYIGLTLQSMHDFGVRFDVSTRDSRDSEWQLADWREIRAVRPGLIRFRVRPSLYRAGNYAVEGDWSGASYLLAAGALGSRPVRVEGLRSDTMQGDRAIRVILERMGARTEEGENSLTVYPSPLKGVEADMSDCPDLVPTVAVLAAFAEGETLVRGVAHLRIKECDRIAAPAGELGKAGVPVEERPDGLMIRGNPELDLRGRALELLAHGDHRMAMSLSLLECKGASVRLDNPAVVNKSFPAFWDVWKEIRG